MQKIYLLVLALLCTAVSFTLSAQTGCPGCVIDLPDLPEDTIYLSSAPNGTVGEPYDADLSFRLPKTTTPVAGEGTPPDLPISKFVINNVSGLPAGLTWEANALEFMTADTTDGCVKLCGQPLVPGLYNVEVVVTATVLIIEQTTSFSFPLLILPGEVVTDGFSVINSEGCGSVTASFANNIPSGGNPGYSYFWDFGNGNVSLEENPVDQTYTAPGTYPINYQVVIDTLGHFLQQVTINAVSCDDLLNGPDLMINVYDPAGELIYQSSVTNNADLPLVYDLLIPIDTGTYTLQVTDDDSGLGGGDDQCALVNFGQTLSGSYVTPDFDLEVTIIHPVDTLDFSATVTVYEQPSPPVVLPILADPLCEGDMGILFVEEAPGDFQWYRDSLPLTDAVSNELTIEQSGTYYVNYTSPDGCQAASEPYTVTFGDLPAGVVLTQEDNLLRVLDPGLLPAAYSVTWTLDGTVLPEEGLLLCAMSSGAYALTITDLANGCAASDTVNVIFNPDVDCTTPTSEVAALADWRVYPNPAHAILQVRLPFGEWEGRLVVLDALGRTLYTESIGQAELQLNVEHLPQGMYWLQWQLTDGRVSTRRWQKF